MLRGDLEGHGCFQRNRNALRFCRRVRRGLKMVSKLLRPPRSAFGAASQTAVIKSLDFQTVSLFFLAGWK
jgi:hypothetical protein